jgi:RNA polymerase sigma-70 factor (ECF subfamily)
MPLPHNPVLAPPAADLFVARHQRGVWRWLRALGCDAQAAEEHCQDALFAALHHGIDRLEPRDAERWLRTAAKRLFWMRLRTERRMPPRTSLEALEAEWARLRADADGGDAALAALRACLAGLPERERELVAARYGERQGREAMACRFGASEAGIKQALRRARAKLRDCIERRLRARES